MKGCSWTSGRRSRPGQSWGPCRSSAASSFERRSWRRRRRRRRLGGRHGRRRCRVLASTASASLRPEL